MLKPHCSHTGLVDKSRPFSEQKDDALSATVYSKPSGMPLFYITIQIQLRTIISTTTLKIRGKVVPTW